MENERKLTVRKMVIIGILGAVSIMLGMTPIGFIPIGPTKATIMHIPVIIGAILEGPLVGALVGFIFGLFSMYQAVTSPTLISFAFRNPIVAMIPRVMIGIVAYYVYNALRKLGNKKTVGLLYVIWAFIVCYLCYGIYTNIVNSQSIWLIIVNVILIVLTLTLAYLTHKKFKDKAMDVAIAAILGTITNTAGVMTLVYFIYAERFVEALGGDVANTGKVILGIALTNGIPEMIIAVIIVTSVVSALKNRR